MDIFDKLAGDDEPCDLRRQHSAPARLLLGKLNYCLEKVSLLTDRVDTLSTQTRSRSVSDLALIGSWQDPSTSTMGDENSGKQRTCHSCHCPLNDPYHAGVQPGLEQCTLAHWNGCAGGVGSRGANGKEWKECPDVRSSEEEETEADLKNESKLDDKTKKVEEILSSEESGSDSDDEELRIRQEEVEKLKRELAKQSKDQKKAEKKEKKRIMLENLELEKIELEKKTKAAKKQVTQDSVPQPSNLLKERAAAHAANQQQRAELKSQQVDVEGLTMQQIRSLPGMSAQVENILTSLQGGIPSLSKVASAARGTGPGFQPPGVLGEQEQSHKNMVQSSDDTGTGIDGDYVFVAELGKLVRIVQTLPKETSSSLVSDEDTSEDEDCPIEPEAGHHLVWKKDKFGRKYFVSKANSQAPAPAYHYVYDEQTGRHYKEALSDQVQPAAKKKKQQTLATKQPVLTFTDHRQGSSPVGGGRLGGVEPEPDERRPSFLAGDGERKGRESEIDELLKWARDCPVSWTNKITVDKLNVVLYTWSYISSLLASRTGRAPDLPVGELESRLQHLLHVLEVTLQTSTQSDYTGESWKIARLYHTKVQQKVDSKLNSWVELTKMHHNATLPHELMAAMQELANKPKLQKRGDDSAVGGRGDGSQGNGARTERRICPSWNLSEVRGKCTWETEHSGQKCKFTHSCTWCKWKKFTPVDHQRSFCRKRQDAEED